MSKGLLWWMAVVLTGLLVAGVLSACGSDKPIPPAASEVEAEDVTSAGQNILFLHHSTGGVIWEGGVAEWFEDYNAEFGTSYHIVERAYPGEGYPWDNYPYDYWNIWVKHDGDRPYKKQDTLEIMTRDHEVIVWKHCYPVSRVQADSGSPNIGSDVRSLENYKLQYQALKDKMRQFPETKFIVWTGAALVARDTDEAQATRAREFFTWVTQSWDEPGDNIFVWDFYQLETEGGLYLLDQYAAGATDSHPNSAFAASVAPLLAQRIADVIEGRGDSESLTGQ